MDGVRSTVSGTVNNANRTINNAGTAAGVAANEMPRFNNNMNAGINVVDQQAGQFNNNMNAGVNVVNQQAGEFNSNMNAGVNVVNQQAGEFNNNMNAGVNVVDQQAGELNRNLDAGINVANAQAGELNRNLDAGINVMNEQAGMMNQNAANGIDMLNRQAGELNMTADGAVDELERAVTSFETTNSVISNAIELWAPSIKLFVDILGPLQYFVAAHYFVLILKNLGVLPNRSASCKELLVTNTILQDMAGAYREVESPGIVQNITDSSMKYDESTNTIHAYFFFTQNNIVTKQLRGLNYFAYDTISELFEKVYVWNAFAHAATQTRKTYNTPTLSTFDKRHTVIYFLDPCPKSTVLSHMEFTDIHQNVTIINHYQAVQHLTIESVKVQAGCSVRFEYLTVCKVDATYGGKAHMHKCQVGWNQASVPFLFGGKPDLFDNPHNVCGTVCCHECHTFDPSNSRWKGWKSPSKGIMRCSSNKNGSFFPSGNTALSSTERTITNISDQVWYIRFKPAGSPNTSLMKARTSGVKAGSKGDLVVLPTIKDMEFKTTAIPPFGGSITVSITSDTYSSKPIGGELWFIDRSGEEYIHLYKHRSNLTDFTIVRPTIDGGREAMAKILAIEREEAKAKDVKDTILVVGRFGSGKSTLLNTLAGAHWTFIHDSFQTNCETGGPKVEKFATSHSAKGCTVAAVSKDILTFDGRDISVIDTVGYDDTINAENFYNTSNLTEVISQHEAISAIVIVVNSRDPRLTQGFVESVLCIPKSFKRRIQENIVLVFTNWNEDDEDEHGDKPSRGFTEQLRVMRKALGFTEDDGPIPAFWMDNRPFKKYTENARRTIDSLSSLLNKVSSMPKLSSTEFKEMRALSQFERSVRKAIQEYFKPSGNTRENPSGFEKFLFESAVGRAERMKKVTLTRFTAKEWSDALLVGLQEDINHGLPNEIQRICEEVDLEMTADLQSSTLSRKGSVGETLMFGLVGSSFTAMVATAPFTFGLSFLALPLLPALAHAYSKTWSRQDIIGSLVSNISNQLGEKLRQSASDQFTIHVDAMVQKLQECFDAA